MRTIETGHVGALLFVLSFLPPAVWAESTPRHVESKLVEPNAIELGFVQPRPMKSGEPSVAQTGVPPRRPRRVGESQWAVVRDTANRATVSGGALWTINDCGSRPQAFLRWLTDDGEMSWRLDETQVLESIHGLDVDTIVASEIHDLVLDPVDGEILAAGEVRRVSRDLDTDRRIIRASTFVLRLETDGAIRAQAVLDDTILDQALLDRSLRPEAVPRDPSFQIDSACADVLLDAPDAEHRHRIAVETDGSVSLTRWPVRRSGPSPADDRPPVTLSLTSNLEPRLEKAVVSPPAPPQCLGQHSGLVDIVTRRGTEHLYGDRLDAVAPDDCAYVVRFDPSVPSLPLAPSVNGLVLRFDIDPAANRLTFPLRLRHMGGKVTVHASLKRRNGVGPNGTEWDEIGKVASGTDGWIDDRSSLSTDRAQDYILDSDHAGGNHQDNVHMRLTLETDLHAGSLTDNCEETRIDHCDCETE